MIGTDSYRDSHASRYESVFFYVFGAEEFCLSGMCEAVHSLWSTGPGSEGPVIRCPIPGEFNVVLSPESG